MAAIFRELPFYLFLLFSTHFSPKASQTLSNWGIAAPFPRISGVYRLSWLGKIAPEKAERFSTGGIAALVLRIQGA